MGLRISLLFITLVLFFYWLYETLASLYSRTPLTLHERKNVLEHRWNEAKRKGEDILLGTDFLSPVAPFAFFPDGFSYTIRNPHTGTIQTFRVPWVEKQSIFGEGGTLYKYN